MFRNRKQNRRNRRLISPWNAPLPQSAVAAVTLNAGKMRMTFATPVVVSGVPTSITVQDVLPTTVTVVSSTVVDLTFAAPPVAGNTWKIGERDAALRTTLGGYVASATGTF